ncbi:MAG TPA: orotate phosphoribosyltransferase [Acidobacteriota bacterium]|nr:orotate phosphoribosyltransferase [Acidobacteriota bacterium]
MSDAIESKKARLLELLREKSLKIGKFTLTSGMTSHYYFDSKPTTLDPEGACLTAELILHKLREEGVRAQAIGGLSLGADPVVSSVAAMSHVLREAYDPLPAFIVRKEAKGHGTQRFIEGFKGREGDPVVIVDDVCTTGGSTLNAIEKAEQAGYQVAAVVALVDRQQGGAERLSNYPFFPILTAKELLDDPDIQRQLRELET